MSSRAAVENEIASELARRGANQVAIAGILGNAWRESRMDPGAEGTGGGGLWGFTAGAVSLANLKKAGGGRWKDPVFQTDFMLAHGGQGLIAKLNHAKSPEEAARVFMEEWERPGIPAQADREAGARYSFKRLANLGGFSEAPTRPKQQPVDAAGVGGIGGDLLHVAITGALVLGGAALVGLGVTRVFGTGVRS